MCTFSGFVVRDPVQKLTLMDRISKTSTDLYDHGTDSEIRRYVKRGFQPLSATSNALLNFYFTRNAYFRQKTTHDVHF